jgi:autotransporter translocation and assembly factor TamB
MGVRRRLARAVLGTVLALFALSLLGVVTLFLVGRSSWGRQRILSIVLPAVEQQLVGKLRLGALDGDLTHMLVLRDVELEDAEGQLAARLPYIGLRYNLLALLGRTLHLHAVDIRHAEVHARLLRDGRLNLAALVRPGDSAPATGPLPLRVLVSGIDVALAADFTGGAAPPLGPARGQLRLRGSLDLRPDRNLAVTVDELGIETSAPLKAQLALRGKLALGLLAVQKTFSLREVELTLAADGSEVTRLVPAAGLRGPLALAARLDGTLDALAAQLTLTLPKGRAQLQAKLGLLDARLPWQLALALEAVEPAALRPGLPPGQINLSLRGQGSGTGGRLELQSLSLRTANNALSLSGSVEAPEVLRLAQDPLAAQLELQLQLAAPELAELSRLSAVVPPLGGALRGSVHLGLKQRSLSLSTSLRGTALRGFGTELGHLQLDLESKDLAGKLQLVAANLAVGGQRFARVALTAAGDQRLVLLSLDGEGPEAMKLKLALQARPQLKGGGGLFALQGSQLTGLVVDLSALQLNRAGAQLTLAQPTQLRLLQLGGAPVVEVDALALALGTLRLRLGGRYQTQDQRLRATIDASHLDVQELVRVATGAATAPKSELALHAELAGTVTAPTGKLSLSGAVEPPPGTLPGRMLPALTATLGERRVRGELTLHTEAAVGTSPVVTARFSAPLARDGAVELQLAAESPLEALRPLLPPPLADLSGAVAAQLSLSGTLQQPQAALKVTLPRWQLSPVRSSETTLSVTYQQQQLAAQLAARVLTLDGQPLVWAQLSAQAPLRLQLDGGGGGPGASPASVLEQLRSGAGAVELTLHELALPRLLPLASGAPPLLAAGTAELAVQAHGPLLHPTVRVRLDASGLRGAAGSGLVLALGERRLGAALRFDYQREQAALNLAVELEGKPLLRGQASAPVRVAELLGDRETLLAALPLRAQLELLPTTLPLLGSVRAYAEVSGTPRRPQLAADATATGLAVGQWPVGDLTLHATLDAEQLLKARATVVQPAASGAGTLALDATVPLPLDLTTAELKVALLAKNFRLDYQVPKGQPAAVRLLRGTLDSDLTVQGGTPRPLVLGGLGLHDGQLAAAALPQLVRDIVIELRAKPGGVIRLERALARADQGSIRAEGGVQLADGVLHGVELTATIDNFPIAAGAVGLWLDTKLQVSGTAADDTLRVKVNIPFGTVRLPKLTSGSDSDVQALGPLEDMRFDDAAARAAAAEEAREAGDRAASQNGAAATPSFLPQRTLVSVELPPALAVSGPEVRTHFTGHLDAELGGRPTAGPIVTGDIRSLGGWVEILGRRYQLDRAQVSMSGEVPPNPLLNIVLWRKLDDATIYILVGGTARHPTISFRSDPALYDQAQVIGMVLSGSRGGSIQQQALGALSGLLVGKLKDSLGSAVPVDVIKFDVGGNDASGANQSSLEVGKYLRDNLYLSYTHRFGSPSTILHRLNNDQVALEWSFLPGYQVNLMAGDQGVGALNLYWTRRF